MPTTISVELTCAEGFEDLQLIAQTWQDAWETPDPELAAVTLRLFGAHMVMQSQRLLHAMICERLDAEEALQHSDQASEEVMQTKQALQSLHASPTPAAQPQHRWD